jgi:putative FmdB family regulatory protein
MQRFIWSDLMPIYEYECKKCGSTFEAMQKISAKPLKTCEMNECRGKVQRLVSASGFILKGSGWYTTDYPSDARKQGWESEGKHDKTQNTDATPATETSEKTAKAPAEKAPANKEPMKPKAKNPYSGGNKKKAKSTK